MLGYGGLKISDNTAPSIAPGTAAKHTEGWAAMGVGSHGSLAVQESAANSRLICEPGVYHVSYQMTVESEDVSGTSGDAAGVVNAEIYAAGVATGLSAKTNHTGSDLAQSVTVIGLVEITDAQKDAGTNYIEGYIASGDGSGNDVTVRDAQLVALRVR